MNKSRRDFMGKATAVGAVALLSPQTLLAIWPKAEFSITEFEQAMQGIIRGRKIVENQVQLKVPSIAENGAQVRVEVSAELTDVKAINLLVEKNPIPLTSRFMLMEDNEAYVAVNLKVRETSKIVALVETKDKIYRASQEVRVTAGGCE